LSNIFTSGVGDLPAAKFSASPGQKDDTPSIRNLGDDEFFKVVAYWYLAGINDAANIQFDANNMVDDFSEFNAALFDKGGFYEGSDVT
jgi:hypothetical protein